MDGMEVVRITPLIIAVLESKDGYMCRYTIATYGTVIHIL